MASTLTRLAAAWLGLLLITEFLVAERNALAAAVTYVPQHLFVLPLLPAMLVSLLAKRWKLVLLNGLLLGMFLVMLMGLNIGLPRRGDGDLKVMTINLARSAGKVDPLMKVIKREKPDVLFVQEANPLRRDRDALGRIIVSRHPGGDRWYSARSSDVAIASRYPLTSVRNLALLRGSGRRMLVANTRINGRDLTLACIHFATNVPGASRRRPIRYLRGSAKSRTTQARALLAVLPSDNTIMAGDFNLPPRGLAFTRIARKYADTFSVGAGFGYTYRANLPVMRIDHVFASRDLTPVRWRAVDTAASDHRAVVVDIDLRR